MTERNLGGRPPVGPTIHLKLPPELLHQLDLVAAAWGCSRSEAVRRLIALGLVRSAGK